jgi:5-methylcytosine-specific restriction endonuclease McrA
LQNDPHSVGPYGENRKNMIPICLEKEIGTNQTLVVDSTMSIQGRVDWTRAVTLLMADEAYTLIPRADGSLVRSPTMSIRKPLVVCLNKYVKRQSKIMLPDDSVSKKTILIRDNWTCQYCGKFGDTIDHILPKSRGGGNTWGNLCAACKSCNGAKDNMTPKEAGLKNPVIPQMYSSRRQNALQDAVFKELELMMV